MKRSILIGILPALLLLLLIGCPMTGNTSGTSGDLDSDGILDDVDTDIDGDGLDNALELTLHSNPWDADTDGDGFDDRFEKELFDAVSNQSRFNPLIADIPRFDVILQNSPSISMGYTYSDGTSVSYTSENTVEIGESNTESNSDTDTDIFENSFTIEVGYGTGADIGWHTDVSYSHTDTREYSTTHTTEQTKEYREAATEAEENCSEESRNSEGGSIQVAVSIQNSGHIAYTVKNLTLSAYSLNYDDSENPVDLIGTLDFETTQTSFPQVTIGPGESTDYMSFENDGLYVDEVIELLADSEGICIGVSGYSITMQDTENGIDLDFTESSTKINSKTALFKIDYGPFITDRTNEEYNVATLTKYNQDAESADDLYETVTLEELFDYYLDIDYGYNDDGRLNRIRDVECNDDKNQSWYLVHSMERDGVESTVMYSTAGLDPADIGIRSGDTLALILGEDRDGDGLTARMERMYLSSDLDTDSDDDGLDDLFEVKGWDNGEEHYTSSPALADTDYDGRDDYSEYTEGTDPGNILPSFGDFTGSITASDITSSSVTFNWDADDDVVHFWLYKNGSMEQETINHYCTWTGLEANTTYQFGFIGTDGQGYDTIYQTPMQIVPVTTLPASVTNLRVTDAGDSYIDLAWDPVDTSLYNHIYVSTDNGATYNDAGHVGTAASTRVSHSAYPSSTDNALVPVFSYRFYIRSQDPDTGALSAPCPAVTGETIGYVILYLDANFENGIISGLTSDYQPIVGFHEGSYSLGDSANQVSSIIVPERYSLIAYSHGNWSLETEGSYLGGPFKGPCTMNLDFLNDDIDSFQVVKTADLPLHIMVYDDYDGNGDPDLSEPFRYIPISYNVVYNLDDFTFDGDGSWQDKVSIVSWPAETTIYAAHHDNTNPTDYVHPDNSGSPLQLSGDEDNNWNSFKVVP